MMFIISEELRDTIIDILETSSWQTEANLLWALTPVQAPVVDGDLSTVIKHLDLAISNEDWDEAREASNRLDIMVKSGQAPVVPSLSGRLIGPCPVCGAPHGWRAWPTTPSPSKMREEVEWKYWCDDCLSFVEKDHRCQQWSTVWPIPPKAISAIKSEGGE